MCDWSLTGGVAVCLHLSRVDENVNRLVSSASCKLQTDVNIKHQQIQLRQQILLKAWLEFDLAVLVDLYKIQLIRRCTTEIMYVMKIVSRFF